MEYSKELTMEHPLSSFGRSLNELIRKDGGKGVFPNDYIALSMDEVEIDKRRSNQRRTMDCAIGTIRKRTAGRNAKNKKMLMCEFKFRVSNPQSVSEKELEEKIQHTRILLQKEYIGHIHEKCYFLFSEKVVDIARNNFERLYANKIDTRVVMTEEELEKLLRIESRRR